MQTGEGRACSHPMVMAGSDPPFTSPRSASGDYRFRWSYCSRRATFTWRKVIRPSSPSLTSTPPSTKFPCSCIHISQQRAARGIRRARPGYHLRCRMESEGATGMRTTSNRRQPCIGTSLPVAPHRRISSNACFAGARACGSRRDSSKPSANRRGITDVPPAVAAPRAGVCREASSRRSARGLHRLTAYQPAHGAWLARFQRRAPMRACAGEGA